MEQDIAALKKVIERLTDELQFANLESSMEKRQVEIGFLPTRASRATDDKSLAGFVVFALTMFSIILILISLPGWIRRMRRRKEVIASRPA